MLGEAAAAFRAALRVRSETVDPVRRATTVENLGAALEVLADNPARADPDSALAEAAACFEAAPRVFDPVQMAPCHERARAALARVLRKMGGSGTGGNLA